MQEIIKTKLVGSTFKTEAPSIIKKLRQGNNLRLVPEPDNAFDSNAIKIMTIEDEHIGYVQKELAAQLSEGIKAGIHYYATVIEVTGGEEGKENIGCNISIKKYDIEDELIELPSKIYSLENRELAFKRKLEDLKNTLSVLYDSEFHAISQETIIENEKEKKKYSNEDARKFATMQRMNNNLDYQDVKKEIEDKSFKLQVLQTDINYNKSMLRSWRVLAEYKTRKE